MLSVKQNGFIKTIGLAQPLNAENAVRVLLADLLLKSTMTVSLRSDLYYRLKNVVMINAKMQPLRQTLQRKQNRNRKRGRILSNAVIAQSFQGFSPFLGGALY